MKKSKEKELFPREYRIWKIMRARCNAPCFKHLLYQQKNIKVCKRWDVFKNFIEDMGPCPNKKWSIDRINTEGNYEPSNCRWASQIVQSRNRGKFNINVEINGQIKCLKQIAAEYNIPYLTLYDRYHNHPELSIEQLITFKDKRRALIEWEGKLCTKKELCDRYNLSLQQFYDRKHKGWSIEKILLTPIHYKI